MYTINKEGNIITSLFKVAYEIIETLEMDVSRFYHSNYLFGEEI